MGMIQNRCAFHALFCLAMAMAMALSFSLPVRADSHDNLNIMVGMIQVKNKEKLAVSREPGAKENLGFVRNLDNVYVVGKATAGTVDWLEIRSSPGTESPAWLGSGWIPAAAVREAYSPEFFGPLVNRLEYRLTIDYGYYPDMCFKLLGKPLKHEQAYDKSVIDFLKYRHLTVMLVRTTKRIQGGQLHAVTIDPRYDKAMSFGPLKIGSSASDLQAVFPGYSGKDGVWIFRGEFNAFRFTVTGGLIRSMQFGGSLAAKHLFSDGGFFPLPIEAKPNYPDITGYFKGAYQSDKAGATPWTSTQKPENTFSLDFSGDGAPSVSVSLVSSGGVWDVHLETCDGNAVYCNELWQYLSAGGRLMILTPLTPPIEERGDITSFRAKTDPALRARLANRSDLSEFMQAIGKLDCVYENDGAN
ncbi:MAG: hypothetical protein LBN33_02960 [Desulfovibrio sp.]|jgi:hypothetical protein|nr:hypothetical protein [Desulfovibrio sp.]